MKAIVLEIKNGYAAVMREDGVVTKTRQPCRVGETIELTSEVVPFPIDRKRLLRNAVAAVLALSLAGGSYGYTTAMATSYVSLDVDDSSVEFSINRIGRVISVKGINDGGEALAETLNQEVRNKTVDDAMDVAMVRLRDEGYLTGTVIAGVTSDKEEQRSEIARTVERSVIRHSSQDTQVVTLEATRGDRGEARKKEQSAGRFLYDRRRMDTPATPKDGEEEQGVSWGIGLHAVTPEEEEQEPVRETSGNQSVSSREERPVSTESGQRDTENSRNESRTAQTRNSDQNTQTQSNDQNTQTQNSGQNTQTQNSAQTTPENNGTAGNSTTSASDSRTGSAVENGQREERGSTQRDGTSDGGREGGTPGPVQENREQTGNARNDSAPADNPDGQATGNPSGNTAGNAAGNTAGNTEAPKDNTRQNTDGTQERPTADTDTPAAEEPPENTNAQPKPDEQSGGQPKPEEPPAPGPSGNTQPDGQNVDRSLYPLDPEDEPYLTVPAGNTTPQSSPAGQGSQDAQTNPPPVPAAEERPKIDGASVREGGQTAPPSEQEKKPEVTSEAVRENPSERDGSSAPKNQTGSSAPQAEAPPASGPQEKSGGPSGGNAGSPGGAPAPQDNGGDRGNGGGPGSGAPV